MDVGITIALAVLAFISGYLGFHMTLHPPETQRNKRLYKTGFAAVSLISLLLIGIQARRNDKASKQLQVLLDQQGKDIRDIKDQSGRPIVVNPPAVNVPGNPRYAALDLIASPSYDRDPLPLDRNIAWNLLYKNSGNDNAREVIAGGRIFIEDGPPERSQKYIMSKFKRWWNSGKGGRQAGEIQPATNDKIQLTTIEGPLMDSRLYEDLTKGNRTLFFVWGYRYKDETGDWEGIDCESLQPPHLDLNERLGVPALWRRCQEVTTYARRKLN